MLTKITTGDLTSKEAKYHGVCRVKYQSETESALEGRKASLTVAFSHSHSYGTKKEKLKLKRLMLFRFTLKIGFWKKEKFIYLLMSKVIIWHFSKILWTQI